MKVCVLFLFPGEEEGDMDFDAPKVYEPIANFQALRDRLNMYMALYNETVRGAKMDLVFFKVMLRNGHWNFGTSIFRHFFCHIAANS